jgi:uncharacterized protein YndB with AHSA1/START domain
MGHQAPLKYVFYIAAIPEKVWEGLVSRESNRIIFSGAEFEADLKPGGLLAWAGAGPDGKPMTYVRGKVLRFEPPKVFQYTFAMGQNDKTSRATIELMPETEATKVTVTHDEWAEDDSTYAACADGRHSSRIDTRRKWSGIFRPAVCSKLALDSNAVSGNVGAGILESKKASRRVGEERGCKFIR